MVLQILSSESSGNCYVIQSDTEALIIEAGIRFLDVKKALKFNTSKVAGCLISHAHLDHAKYTKELVNAGIDVYSSSETFESLGILSHRLFTIEPGIKYKIGNFAVKCFDLKHDIRCFGFLIYHSQIGVTCFITDSYFVPNKFSGLNNILVEVNYAEDILDNNISNGSMPAIVRNRVLASHMSLQTCKGFLLANDLSKVNNIVLLHLSSGNSDAKRFKAEIEGITGKTITIADKNINVDLNVRPF